MPSKRKGRSAWLVRWEWAGDHAAVEQPIAAVLPHQWGHERVATVVAALHAQRAYEPDEMLDLLTRGTHDPYPVALATTTVDVGLGPQQVPWGGAMTCGHNPYLVATVVRGLRIQRESSGALVAEWEAPAPRDLTWHQHTLRISPSEEVTAEPWKPVPGSARASSGQT